MTPDVSLPREVLGGKYSIVSEIGRGGMGIVYRGIQRSLGRTVAIKALSPHLAVSDEFVQRFRREAEALARLNQGNIVTIHDFEREGEDYLLVMEFVDGRSLSDLMAERGRVPPGEAVSIAASVADALDAAHRNGVVHRDIKPDNILIDSSTQVPKVTDFGIAAMADSEYRTTTGTLMGTPKYMAPEQVRGSGVTGAADIYALGAVLYEMLSGRPVFEAETPMALAFKQVNEVPASLSEVAPDTPDALVRIVMKSLDKDPARRFATAGAMAASLREALSVIDRAVPSRRALRTARPSGRAPMPSWAWIAGACVFAAGGTVAAVHLLRRPAETRPAVSQVIQDAMEPDLPVVDPAEITRPPDGDVPPPPPEETPVHDAPEAVPSGPSRETPHDVRDTQSPQPSGSEMLEVRALIERWQGLVSRRNLPVLLMEVEAGARPMVQRFYSPVFEACEDLECTIVDISIRPTTDPLEASASFTETITCPGSPDLTQTHLISLVLTRSHGTWMIRRFNTEP